MMTISYKNADGCTPDERQSELDRFLSTIGPVQADFNENDAYVEIDMKPGEGQLPYHFSARNVPDLLLKVERYNSGE